MYSNLIKTDIKFKSTEIKIEIPADKLQTLSLTIGVVGLLYLLLISNQQLL